MNFNRYLRVWGDDQFENYREDCVPAFSVLAYDSADFPTLAAQSAWHQFVERSERKIYTVRGHRSGANTSRHFFSIKDSILLIATSRCTSVWDTRLPIPFFTWIGIAQVFLIRWCRSP
jgi:hypothetical protein